MLVNPSPLQEAEMRLEFRRLYKEIGAAGCLQVLFEILKTGEWLSEIILEEKALAAKRTERPLE